MTAINQIISATKLFSVDEFGHSYELTVEQIDFTKTLLSKIKQDSTYQVFRGTSLSRIHDQFNTYDFDSILSLCFFVGEKAAHFYRNKILKDFENIDEVISKIKEHKLEKHFSGNAFDKIKELLTGREIKSYAYYSYILHVLNKMNNPSYSHLLSASSDYDTACDFSHGSVQTAHGIILFIVKPIRLLSQTTNLDTNFESLLQDLHLPINYDGTFFNEEEVNFIFGVYPQCIYAIQDNDNGNIYINPSLFKSMNNEEEEGMFLRTLEINVDQSNFEKLIKETNVKNYIHHVNGEYKFYNVE